MLGNSNSDVNWESLYGANNVANIPSQENKEQTSPAPLNNENGVVATTNAPMENPIKKEETKEQDNIVRMENSTKGIKYPKNFMSILLLISNPILDGIIRIKKENVDNFDMFKLIKKIAEKRLGYFNKPNKIKYLITALGNNPPIDKYNFTCKVYSRTFATPINFNDAPRITVVSGRQQNIDNTSNYIKDKPKLSSTGKDIENQVKSILVEINKASNNVGEDVINEGSGWTDDTLSRIDNIFSILNNYSSGMINPENLKVCHMVGNVASGWTDDTLSRIDNILSTLNNYSSGMINPILLKVMNRQKGYGWTNDTLSRIENINNTLSQYI
jgi:hypothetical protein